MTIFSTGLHAGDLQLESFIMTIFKNIYLITCTKLDHVIKIVYRVISMMYKAY